MAEREVNIIIKIDVDSKDAFSEIEKDLKKLKSQIVDFSDATSLTSQRGIRSWKDLTDSVRNFVKGESGLSIFASRLKTTESNLTSLYSNLKGNVKLENEFFGLARSAGFSERQIAKLDFQLNASARTTTLLSSVFKGFAQIGSYAFNSIIVPSLKVGIALEKQIGVLKNLSGNEYPKLQDAINNTIQISKGLTTQKELTEAANEAIKTGASVEFISKNLSGLQKVSRLTNQDLISSMKGAYKAIEDGSEEFLKSNGALFSSYSAEFKQINESGMSAIDKRLAREKLISAALNENSILQNNYVSHVKNASVILERFDKTIERLKESFGLLLAKALTPSLNVIGDLIDYFTIGGKSSEYMEDVLVIFGSILVGVLGAIAAQMIVTSGITFGAMIPSLLSMAAAGFIAIAPWIVWIAIGVALGAMFAIIILVIKDLYKWFTGSESAIGKFLGPFANIKKMFRDLIDWFKSLPGKILSSLGELGSNIQKKLGGIFPLQLLKVLGITSSQSSDVKKVDDALITKQGQIVQFHPDDNLVAVKDLGVLGGSKSKSGGNSININIANVVLGSASTKEDANVFASYLEKELEKIATKIGLGAGISPEAVL
ncbi:LIC12611 family phage tail protein [Leptospira interrogans]|uniref:Uncharacterized protein n=1 Tax=Leptospira interrogans str. 2006001854 TaxID=1001590 RepID=M6GI44_LEPIR|nr:hypothetical protein [Leptospira interrogans]EMM82992.1 hypothetical protein LEP1GSC037_0968 [Leptospira interrogans str. 2006001854]EMN69907.1 hypothetical protein LEP1GSC100_4985 [Leptospira interrogans serovar Bataviae str. UI 08561]UMQ57558.1 hypothetical protein FH585_14995 [Leptospira interrogans]UNE66308.1 hypothetical protein FH588_17345 [Leptospira interrogans]